MGIGHYSRSMVLSAAMSSSGGPQGTEFHKPDDLRVYLSRLGSLYSQYAQKLWEFGVRSSLELANASVATLRKAGVQNDLHVDNIKATAAKEQSATAAQPVTKEATKPAAASAPATAPAAASKPTANAQSPLGKSSSTAAAPAASASGTMRDAGKGAASAGAGSRPGSSIAEGRGTRTPAYSSGAANRRPAPASSSGGGRSTGPSSSTHRVMASPGKPTGYGAFRMPRGRDGPDSGPWPAANQRSSWSGSEPPRPYSAGDKRPASAVWGGAPPPDLAGPRPMGPPPYNSLPPPSQQLPPPNRAPEYRPEPGYGMDADRPRLPPQSGYPQGNAGRAPSQWGQPPPLQPLPAPVPMVSAHMNGPPPRQGGPPPLQPLPVWQPPPMSAPGPGPYMNQAPPPNLAPAPYMGRPQTGYGSYPRDPW